MNNNQELYEAMDFTLEVIGNAEMVELSVILLASTPRERTLVASVLVDGIELIGSERIVLHPGEGKHLFRNKVMIRRPVLYSGAPEEYKGTGSYTLTLLFHHAGSVCRKLEKTVLFPAEALKDLPAGETLVPLFIS